MTPRLKSILFHPIGGPVFNRVIAKLKKIVWFLVVLTVFTSSVFTAYVDYALLNEPESEKLVEGPIFDEVSQETPASDCNATGIELHGELLTYIPASSYNDADKLTRDQSSSESIVYAIDKAEKDDRIKAIILEVDSYGGSPVAAEEISVALRNAKKPTVALIREGGASAAYFAATGANRVFASKNSDVGSIGVTRSFLSYVGQNTKDGLTYISLSSGKFKDTGDPDKILSQEEKALIMRDINIVHQNFIKAVAENRNLNIEAVKKLADGSTMLGEAAIKAGLIDQIGSMPEVKEYLKEKVGEEVSICW